jgi:hypothetical protein
MRQSGGLARIPKALDPLSLRKPEVPVAGNIKKATFGKWKYSVDRAATIMAYRKEERGGADTCDCNGCRNFRLARHRAFPTEFLVLLDELRIDPRKDGEVYRCARVAPGRHIYGGWFHFVGTLDETGDLPPVRFGPDFEVWMRRTEAPRFSSLRDKQIVELGFGTEAVPWLLDEPEPM